MNRITLSLCIILAFNFTYANKVDSLKSIASEKDSLGKIDIYMEISMNYCYIQPDSAFHYCNLARNIANDLQQKFLQAKTLQLRAELHKCQGNINKAIEFYLQAIKYFNELNSKQELAIAYKSLGIVYSTNKNDYVKAEYYLDSAYNILSKEKSHPELGQIYFYKGLILLDRKRKNKAIVSFNKCIDSKPLDAKYLYNCHIHLADIHVTNNNYKLAAQHFSKAIIYKDSVHACENELQYSKFEHSLLNHKKEEQIKLLKQNDKIQKQEIKKRQTLNFIISILAFAFLIALVLILVLYKRLLKSNKKLSRQKKEIIRQKENLETVNANLLQAKILAEKNSEFKTDFLANVGHELRTPLNAIIGYAKLMYNNIAKKSNIKYLDNITQASDNLLIIINDLLDFSKIESGKMIVDKSPFNPVNIVTKTISTLRIYAEEKSNALEIHIDPDIPDYVVGDQNHLSQILTHIIRNAIKFSPLNKPISIEVHCSQEGTNCMMTFIVTDHGIGIEESKQEAIFESFNQIRNNDNKKYSGTGLGLSIVKRLVILQEGSINLNSKPNEGTTFTINIPYSITNKPINKIAPEKKTENQVKTINILLVEDNEINQELAKDTILSWGENYKIDVAENGKEAIQALENKDYNLILMDIQMPEMDGHEATIFIRTQMSKEKSLTPILGMTAHALQSEKDLALKNGMNDYITKPFNPIKLKQIIATYVFE